MANFNDNKETLLHLVHDYVTNQGLKNNIYLFINSLHEKRVLLNEVVNENLSTFLDITLKHQNIQQLSWLLDIYKNSDKRWNDDHNDSFLQACKDNNKEWVNAYIQSLDIIGDLHKGLCLTTDKTLTNLLINKGRYNRAYFYEHLMAECLLENNLYDRYVYLYDIMEELRTDDNIESFFKKALNYQILTFTDFILSTKESSVIVHLFSDQNFIYDCLDSIGYAGSQKVLDYFYDNIKIDYIPFDYKEHVLSAAILAGQKEFVNNLYAQGYSLYYPHYCIKSIDNNWTTFPKEVELQKNAIESRVTLWEDASDDEEIFKQLTSLIYQYEKHHIASFISEINNLGYDDKIVSIIETVFNRLEFKNKMEESLKINPLSTKKVKI